MSAAQTRPASTGAVLVGVALGGFFDGVLLHQVLRWHHLLSGGPRGGDLAFQVMADGLFHLLMYLLAVVGLWLLWRTGGSPANRKLLANVLLGFGLWHVLDAVLSHWILGIHRVRMGVENPLAWDVGWLAAFGLAPLALGLWLRRRGGPPSGRPSFGLSVLISILALGAGGASLIPPKDALRLAVFHPGTDQAVVFGAVARAGGEVVWVDPAGQVWAVRVPAGGVARLYGDGARWVTAGYLPAGCFAWSRAADERDGARRSIASGPQHLLSS